MRILCVGGAGYVGSACMRWLNKHGHEPIAYDNLSVGHRSSVPQDQLVHGDINDRQSLAEAMASRKVEAVMHFAASASVPESIENPRLYYTQNVIGTKNVLDAMLDCGIKSVVFSSTAATYAFTDEMPLTESSSQRPQVPYGTTKLAAETMIKDYAKAYGFGYGVLRYFNASGADTDGDYGEDRDHETHLIPLALYVPLGRRPKLTIFGNDYDTRDGTCVRDYVHTDDLAQAHQLTIEALEPGRGLVYNLGTGTGVTVLEVLRACEKVTEQEIAHELAGRRPGDPATLVASSAKIRRELGWKPQHESIESIVATAWRWHNRHPEGYED